MPRKSVQNKKSKRKQAVSGQSKEITGILTNVKYSNCIIIWTQVIGANVNVVFTYLYYYTITIYLNKSVGITIIFISGNRMNVELSH